MLWEAVHARLGAADRRRRPFTIPVHSQTLVCAQELEVQARNTYIRRDHASIPGESASNAWHVDKSIPVTVIPWGGMNIGQRGALLSSIREG
jgi:hypothetical protein